MFEFRLGDEDREYFGCGEWLGFSPWAISIADLEELSERFDFEPEDWPEPYFGALTLEQAGNPDAKPKPPRWQRRAAAWMVLRQNGVDVSWDDAGKVRTHLMVARQSPGKDQDTSPTSEPSTTPPSASSSTSPRKKSTA